MSSKPFNIIITCESLQPRRDWLLSKISDLHQSYNDVLKLFKEQLDAVVNPVIQETNKIVELSDELTFYRNHYKVGINIEKACHELFEIKLVCCNNAKPNFGDFILCVAEVSHENSNLPNATYFPCANKFTSLKSSSTQTDSRLSLNVGTELDDLKCYIAHTSSKPSQTECTPACNTRKVAAKICQTDISYFNFVDSYNICSNNELVKNNAMNLIEQQLKFQHQEIDIDNEAPSNVVSRFNFQQTNQVFNDGAQSDEEPSSSFFTTKDSRACLERDSSSTEISELENNREKNVSPLRREEETLGNIKQYYVKCNTIEKKYESLTNLYSTLSFDQAVIFCHTWKTASWVAKKMCEEKFTVALLSGELDISERASILKRFKEAKERVLVTTNVCSRGIDVEQVTLVVNFDLPVDQFGKTDCETYLHRIGRFGKSGVAINFVMNEKDINIQADIQENLSKKVNELSMKQDLNKSATDNSVKVDKNDEFYEKILSHEKNSLLKKLLRDKLVQSNQELQIQQRDPSSPLYSVKSFEELRLSDNLLRGIYSMGFNRPSKIQETALPLLLANPPENMIAQSQSGTGKTTAFVLTMLNRIKTDSLYPQCLCLSPTYELALQTGKVVESIGKFLPNLKVAYAVKGNRVQRNTQINAQIIIGTPGTTLDWIRFRAFNVSKLQVFVLDKADVMIATQGVRDHSIRVHRQCPDHCQSLLFSATYEEDVMKFAQQIVRKPNLIRLRREEEIPGNIKQYYVKCNTMEKKYESLTNLYTTLSVGQAVIFCHTRKTAKWVAEKMCEEKFIVALLSGELDIRERASVLKRFKEAKERVLVTTNVCLRSIDVEQVTLVVNFDLPVDHFGKTDCETYLHRIGRTGRFGKSGVAINFVMNEKDIKVLNEIERHFGIIIQRLDTDDYDDMERKFGDN